MTKNELIAAIADATGKTTADVAAVIASLSTFRANSRDVHGDHPADDLGETIMPQRTASAGRNPRTGNPIKFDGKIVRVENDGFGIVEFASTIGDSKFGVFSRAVSGHLPPTRQLKLGASVTGLAESDGNDLASVRTLDMLTR